MGVKAQADDKWTLTPVFEVPFELTNLQENAFSSFVGRGSADYQQMKIDYWRFRQGVSE